MTRRHGIQSDTFEKLIFDSGAIYINFVDADNLGTLLGATRGGATFKRSPKYKEIKYEGVPGQVVGQKHLIDVKVTLEVNIISFDLDNLALALPNSAVTGVSLDYLQLTDSTWDAEGAHTLTNIAIVAQISGGADPVVLVLDNPLCDSDLSLPFKDKGETVSKWTFSAFYDEAAGFDNPPWRILWPGDVVVGGDIIETGTAVINYIETGTAVNDIIEEGI